jgi:D-glycero-D-manno-heptose 1,7-bisphosphate phosphatase
VTNQSGIGRGFFTWQDYLAVHMRMLELLAIDRPFAAVYANAYRPDEEGDVSRSWRKPNPGMLFQAASDLDLCLESSVMIGDKLVDLQAADRAGVRQLIHVLSGHGATERPKIVRAFPAAELADSLADVALHRFRSA